MQLIVPVAIKPYIKKYIAGQEYEVCPLELTKTNKYGLFLFNCLEKPTEKNLRQVKLDDIDHAVYSDTLEVMISENFWVKQGCVFTPAKQMDFNKFVSYDFHQEFFNYVKNRTYRKGDINKAIMSFRELYGITEDELSFKTIQRAFQRRNERVNCSLSA